MKTAPRGPPGPESRPELIQSAAGRWLTRGFWFLPPLGGRRERFIDLLWQDPGRITPTAAPACSRDEYVNRILAGGFPMILQRRTSRARTSWFADYVDLVVMRDVLDIARIRQREALPRLLRQFATKCP